MYLIFYIELGEYQCSWKSRLFREKSFEVSSALLPVEPPTMVKHCPHVGVLSPSFVESPIGFTKGSVSVNGDTTFKAYGRGVSIRLVVWVVALQVIYLVNIGTILTHLPWALWSYFYQLRLSSSLNPKRLLANKGDTN